MSHFFTLVILPPEIAAPGPDGVFLLREREAIKAKVAELLAPYDENQSVPEYETICYCVGQKAKQRAREAADAQVGTIDQLRKSFQAPTDDPFSEENDAAWRLHIAPYIKAEEAAFEADPDKNKPDPDCEECHGAGVHPSTYNKRSKWDWWQIGGRWDRVAGGTPRESANGFPFGKGLEGLSGNVVRVKDLADRAPFAIVTPDGEWHERGEMGWWAVVKDEKEKDAWRTECEAILAKYPDHLAVGCDLHI